MKTWLFAALGLGALAPGRGFAGEPSHQPAPSGFYEHHPAGDRLAGPGSGHSGRDDFGRVGPKSSKFNQAGPASPKAGPAGALRLPTSRATVTEVRPAASGKAATTAPKFGLMANGTVTHHEQPAGLTLSRGGAAVLSPGPVRRQGTTEVSLGGLAIPSAKTSAAMINGTAMKRKF